MMYGQWTYILYIYKIYVNVLRKLSSTKNIYVYISAINIYCVIKCIKSSIETYHLFKVRQSSCLSSTPVFNIWDERGIFVLMTDH